MQEIIPLVSSDTAGPLGIKHLPRLWLKTLLKASGQLPDGYKDIRSGFDYIVLEGLHIDPDAARDFILKNRPTYLSFERWICEQPDVDVSYENISRINELLVSKRKTPESRTKILNENGLSQESQIKDGIMLNNLDDWKAVHNQITNTCEQSAAANP